MLRQRGWKGAGHLNGKGWESAAFSVPGLTGLSRKNSSMTLFSCLAIAPAPPFDFLALLCLGGMAAAARDSGQTTRRSV